MSTVSPESTLELPNDKDTFLLQLPQRMAAIEENWEILRKGEWDTEELEKLYKRLREVSEASSRFGLYQLNENVFSVEVYLSSFVGSGDEPVKEQIEAIDGLLRNLKSVTEGFEKTLASGSHEVGQTIFLLLEEEETGVTLEKALDAIGTRSREFDDFDTLINAMAEELPAAVVVDTVSLPNIKPLTSELQRLKAQLSVEIPLIFVSSSSTLQLRVDAIRAGGDAYFVRPFDSHEVAQQIVRLSRPETEEAFRILVVEDDPTQADFAASILRKADMEVVTVTDPLRAIETLQEFTPDLILMDIYMPEINGIELTTVIREYDEYLAIPIVFLSGEQNADKQIDALSVGGDDFIAKPIRPKHLLAVVENRVKRARSLVHATGSMQTHDRVTGLLTRARFNDQISLALESDALHAQPTCVLAIAPDNLEELRKRLGIGGLDQLMSELGRVVREALQDNDSAAKLDDNTIGVLIKRSSNNELNDIAIQLHEHIAAHTFSNKAETENITAGIGMCLFGEATDNVAGLIARAQAALLNAHHEGTGKTHVHSEEDEASNSQLNSEDEITANLRKCLAEDKFVVRYQPMLDLQTRGSENYEIILLMPTPSGDLLQERDFREAAEKAKLAGEVDRWLLERAMGILKKRRESGRHTHIFVHQSGSSLVDPNHPAWLLGRLRARHMVGTGLVLDFRLSDLSSDIKAAQKTIAALREFDVEVSLSRFPEKTAAFKVLRFVGANYISVAPRLLKADRDVISDVIHQSHSANAKVIVGQIDDPRAIDLHWSSGADFLQGNFIQRPLDNMDYDFSQVVI